MNKYKRGSVWRKWDLHVHTPCSLHQGYGGDNKEIWDRYIDDLEGLPDEIGVLGINDYIFLDGYKKVLEYKRNGRLPKIELLLPVIELRINRFGSFSKKDPWSRINFHIIFSNELEAELIEAQFLNAIQNCYQLTPEYKDYWGGVVSKESLQEFGKKIKETSTVNIGESDLKVGFHNLNFKEEEIFKKLNSTHFFRDKYLTALGKTEWDALRWEGSSAEKKDIINKVDFVFTASESKEKYLSAKEKLSNEGVNNTLLDCSDAHHFSNSEEKDRLGNCLTWIKADPTFEGLRQIKFEPELRIKVGENPKKQFPKLKIDGLKISDTQQFQLINQKVLFNNDLVSIIGGRGAGKSALLETLTFCFDKHKKGGEYSSAYSNSYSNSKTYIDYFKSRKAKAKLILSYTGLDNDELESYTTSIQDTENFCEYPLLYLGQNQIEQFANNPKKIHELAFDAVVMNSGLSDEINSLISKLKANEAELISYTKEIEAYRLQLSSFNIEKVKDEKLRIEKEIKLLSSKGTKDIITNLGVSRKKKDDFNRTNELLKKFSKSIEEIVTDYQVRSSEINKLLPLIGVDNENIKIDLGGLVSEINRIQIKINQLTIVQEHNQNMIEAEKQLEGKTEISASYFDSLKSKLEEIQKTLEQYENEKKQLKECENDRYEILSEFDELYKDYDELYSEEIKSFSENHSGILKSLQLKSEIGFNVNKIVRDLYEKVDGRKVRTIDKFAKEVLKLPKSIDNTFNFPDWIKKFKTVNENFNLFYEDGLKAFEEIVFKNYFYLDTQISYEVEKDNFKPLKTLSLGQKGTVLLKLYLSVGSNCPIIIDQPEDHLDNHFIYTDLVTTLRSAKEKRQIILVTHDANIVVNGDSEQVIIARFKDDTINYDLSGSLENPEIRDAVAQILEGGNEAFVKREKKYQFK
jgi:ABC-type lipoprotein export system ATPase subunit